MWLLLSFLSALIFGVRRIYEKQLTPVFGNFSLGFVMQGFGLPAILFLFLFLPLPRDLLHLPWDFWWPLLVIWFLLYPLQTYFLYRSLREGELSHVTPVSALLPVFNVVSSFLIIGELPSALGFMGIAATVLGVYLVLTDVGGDTMARYNKPVLFMVASVACTAIGSTLDKVAVAVSTPVFYAFVNNLGASVLLFALALFYREPDIYKNIVKHVWALTGMGILFAIAFIAFVTAFALGPTSYVLAIRSGGFILAALWGVFILRERMSAKKLAAIPLFLFGVALLALG